MPRDDADADIADHRLADGFTAADLQQRADVQPGLVQQRLGELAGDGAALAHQQVVAFQGGDGHRPASGQRVAAVHRQHQRVAAQHQAHQALVVELLRRGGEVHAVFLQRFQHLLGVADLHRHVDLRVALAEVPHQGEDVIGRGGTDAQAALHLPAVAQEELDVGLLLQQRLDHGQQARASSLTVSRRPPRWKSSTLYWASRLRIWVVTVGWLRPSFLAAWVMLPRRATM